MYQAIITKIQNIRNHPNADKLNLGMASGYQVVISKEVEEGTLGIFFPCDGALSHEMCFENNLYHHLELNKDTSKSGFFDSNRKIRAQKFRGEISEGFWSPLSILSWTGVKTEKLKEGTLIDTVEGNLICEKYFNPATKKAMGQKKSQKKELKKDKFPTFREHFDTAQLRLIVGNIPKGSVIHISEKFHGTSGRTGILPSVRRLGKFSRFWNRTIGKVFKLKFIEQEYKYISGTRRVLLHEKTKEDSFYKGTFRTEIHNKIKEAGLCKGETIFYEIVGYNGRGGAPIQQQKIEDKKLIKRYGSRMVYSYGCDPETRPYDFFVYRITRSNEDGHSIDLSWNQTERRCEELKLQIVPELTEPFIYDDDKEKLLALCEKLSRGDSFFNERHIKEGVVLRAENNRNTIWGKYKGFIFCELEGIQKNTEDFVDIEDIN